MPPKRNQETSIPAVAAASSLRRSQRKRKQPQETAITAVVAAPKKNQRKPKQYTTPITSTDSSASSSRRKRAKQAESPETTIPELATATGSLTPTLRVGLTYNQAQKLIRELMTKFNIRIQELKSEDTNAYSVSFSKVKYEDVAHHVGLEPRKSLQDILTFEIYRSRIPTSLFREIILDLDTMLLQYGPPDDHKNEET